MSIVKYRPLTLLLLAVLVAMETATATGVASSTSPEQQLPLYFGFFPASNATELALKQLASDALQEALAIDEVRRLYCQYTNHSLDTPVANLTSFAYTNPTLDLHVTAYYCDHGAVPGCASYAASPAVAAALGRSRFGLAATALLLTPRTVGFRVDLGDDGALAVWANGEGEAAPGQRAHFTVATSPGVPAVQTGLDLLAVANRVGRPVGSNASSSRVIHFQEADSFLLLLSPAFAVPAVFRASNDGGNGGARASGSPAAWSAMLAASAWSLLGQRLQAAVLRLLGD